MKSHEFQPAEQADGTKASWCKYKSEPYRRVGKLVTDFCWQPANHKNHKGGVK